MKGDKSIAEDKPAAADQVTANRSALCTESELNATSVRSEAARKRLSFFRKRHAKGVVIAFNASHRRVKTTEKVFLEIRIKTAIELQNARI